MSTSPSPRRGAEAHVQPEAEIARYQRLYSELWGTDASLFLPQGYERRPGDLRAATLYALDQLGDLRRARLLELGAGSGMDSVMFARRGAQVVATDIAQAAVDAAQRRFEANAVAQSCEALVMPAEALAFPDASFDRVFARGVLHHVNVGEAAAEIARVLRPGGRAVFIEPLSENRVLNFAREHFRYPHKTRPKGHQGLRYGAVRTLERSFTKTSLRAFYLTSMLNRAFGYHASITPLERLDDWLLDRFPSLGRLCRYCVLVCDST